jgi:uncharacterized protein YndB with AHSA1/START domain
MTLQKENQMQPLPATFTSQANGATLRLERRFAHPPAKVWRALAEPAHLSQWFPFEVQFELALGSPIRFIEKGKTEPSSEGVITELAPPRLFAFSWDSDLLRWEVQSDGDGSLLIFTHTFADRAGAASFASGWHTCLDTLEMVLAGRPVNEADAAGPEWRQQISELHEAYVDLLGLNVGTVERTSDGWQLRFERQLTRPIDQVWAHLSVNESPAIGSVPPPGFTTAAVQAGAITAVDAPNALEYEWQIAGHTVGQVRWELGPGTGHGARLVLTQRGPNDAAAQQPVAQAAWQDHIAQLAKDLLHG